MSNADAPAPHGAPGFGLYVHWPFCAAKCPYCDFNSHVVAGVDHALWARSLVREMEHMASLQTGGPLTSIFFGGGTPSLMDPRTVDMIIGGAAQLWGLADDAEITLEANPTSVEAEKFAGFRAAGVNRLSIGIQALNDKDLKALGRLHSVAEALDAYDLARATFPRVSFDLIYARANQTARAWEAELAQALRLAADHLSLYQLTLEPGTPFHALHEKGALHVPDEDAAAEMYEITQSLCAGAGLPAYEVSNHAAPGAESRHNLTYWRLGDYVGVGPGAHGRLTIGGKRLATDTVLSPEAWLKAVQESGHGIHQSTDVSKHSCGEEYLMMSLRLSEGMSFARFEDLSGAAFDMALAQDLIDGGLLSIDGDRLRATPAGRPVLNALIGKLLA